MRTRRTRWISAAMLAASTAAWSAPAGACGGFFCSQAQPVNQAAERIIFGDNGDGTITAVIQILYDGPSENFSWLLPLGSVPEGDELGVASDIAFTRLQFATNPQFNLTTVVEGECRQNPNGGGGAGGFLGGSAGSGGSGPGVPSADGSVNVEASGVVGAFEYTVISVAAGTDDPATPAVDWLTENGYDIPPGSRDLIGPYLSEGMFLLALRLTKGSDTGSIRPIQITYEASAPMIPIKLTAVAANANMGVMTWVLSSARAVPFNYNALELNEARINWFNASSNYNDVVTAAADDAGGQGFVTEFAGPSSQLAEVVWTSFEESDWSATRQATYASFSELFYALYNRYQSFSGFWDAIRRSVTLPESVAFEDFKSCPSCYVDVLTFTPTAIFSAVEADVIEPLRGVQELLDRSPYVTRLYSTLSAGDMTVDPAFIINAELPAVDNIHRADRVIECNPNVYQFEAPWRIVFPQGTTIRGTADQVGSWPTAVDAQPPNFRVLTLAASGEGAVVADNSSTITSMLADYNAGLPGSASGGGAGGSAGGGSILGSSGRDDGGCSVAGPLGTARTRHAAWLVLAFGAALARARRGSRSLRGSS